jgi:GT2 family glycosyltransferase
VIGFCLRNSDGTPQLSSGFFPTLWGTLTRLVLPRAKRKYSTPPAESSPVSWVTGCCLMLRRECLEELGGFDEDFFLYYEDVDFCRRAHSSGWSVRFEPALRAIHHRPLHSRQVSVPMRVITRHALLTYGAKHWGKWQFRILAEIVGAEAFVRRRWAEARGDRESAKHFNELGAIVREVSAGSAAAARRRLDRLVRRQERLCVA